MTTKKNTYMPVIKYKIGDSVFIVRKITGGSLINITGPVTITKILLEHESQKDRKSDVIVKYYVNKTTLDSVNECELVDNVEDISKLLKEKLTEKDYK